MKSFHNIEKSAFRHGEYVGYAYGLVFRIYRIKEGWIAVGNETLIERPTLALMSVALENALSVTA